jgi:hypothetical protein
MKMIVLPRQARDKHRENTLTPPPPLPPNHLKLSSLSALQLRGVPTGKKKKAIFVMMPFYSKTDDHFTKTGSGHTIGKALLKRERDDAFVF